VFVKKKPTQKIEMATGIDIGNFAVKIAQIKKEEEVFTLEAIGYRKINMSKADGISEAIRVAHQEANLSDKKVNVSIHSDNVIVRYLMLPRMDPGDLKNAMEFEVERYVPFEKKDIVSDFLILDTKSTTRNMKVLLVAAKKDDVQKRAKLVKDAGLEPHILTIDSIVLKNIFQLNYPEKSEKTIGLINIGSKISNINIIKASTSYFMRDVQLGGDNVTHLLKEKLDVNMDNAEEMKCTLNARDKEKFKPAAAL